MIAFDTETNGVDFHHGSRPFFVSTCDDQNRLRWWEWDVDPITRKPKIPAGDISEIRDYLDSQDRIVLHNAKFDITAMAMVGLGGWRWAATEDTLIAAHLLASNQPKNLTAMAVQYLSADISPLESALETDVKAARRYCNSHYPSWRVARAGLPEMPSCKPSSTRAEDRAWAADYWLPRAVATAEGWSVPADNCEHQWTPDAVCRKCKGHRWHIVLREYANCDSWTTINVWHQVEAEIERRKLGKIYQERRKLLRAVWTTENNGITITESRLSALEKKYTAESNRYGAVCTGIAAKRGHTLVLPKAGRNKSLDTCVFDVLKLEKVYSSKTKSDGPCLDSKIAIPHYLATLPTGSDEREFIQSLSRKRTLDTQRVFMQGYRRFWIPSDTAHNTLFLDPAIREWYKLYPSLNPVGTDTLRFGSFNPNSQNISKRGIDSECDRCAGDGCRACNGTGHVSYNLRYGFGPGPGREWWSLDAKNIELRIPAYESGEEELIALFEKSNEPPFYGSNHMLVFSILWPNLWEDAVKKVGYEKAADYCKREYKDTQYQWAKNGNFAVQYGAVDRPDGLGTADRAYHLPGAQARISHRFAKQEALNQHWISFANKHGYVETVPDTSVDPGRGYPLLCSRTDRGNVKPTVPLNYHVQGTAMWWMCRAMVRCQGVLDIWNAKLPKAEYLMVMQVHDELVFDFPKRRIRRPDGKIVYGNLALAREIQAAMELGGKYIGVPTPVSVEYHAENLAVGIAL